MNDVARISYKKFNPNFHHLKEALKDDNLRFIFLKGGSSSAKSFSIAQVFLLLCLTHGYNTKVYRKTGASILDSIYKTFKEASKSLNIFDLFVFKENKIECFNGSYITFSGLDDSEKIKGLESYQFVFCEELNEFDHSDFKQIKKRLRGRKGQKIVSAFNPVSEECWIKKEIFDKETFSEMPNHLYGRLKDDSGKVLKKEYSQITKKLLNASRAIFNPRKQKEELHAPDTLVLWSTYLNNFWVVGSPCGTYGFYDRQTIADFEKDKTSDYNQYCIYALGEWGSIKTGGEFLHAYDSGKHKGKFPYSHGVPVHISIDNNVLPYISVSIWQYITLDDGIKLRQVHEICAEDPFNMVTKASELTRTWLNEIGYKDVVYLYGDASTKANNTIDEEKRSFLDKFTEGLEESYIVEERIPKSNPSVSMTGEFVNAILSGNVKGFEIQINETCSKSIYDYENAKKDVNGCILKKRIKNKLTNQTYEEFGHLTDCMRYFIAETLKDQYTKFSLRRKHNKVQEEGIMYYNIDSVKLNGYRITEINPSINGAFVAVSGILLNNKFYINDVVFSHDFIGTEILAKFLKEDGNIQMETPADMKYYLNDLRVITGLDIFGRKDISNKRQRVEAHIININNTFYFPSNYDDNSQFVSFMENFLSYKNGDNIEAINALACISERIKRLSVD